MMAMLATVALAALALGAPEMGATVPMLRPTQRAYLAQDRRVRFAQLGDGRARRALVQGGDTAPALRLAWRGPTNAVYRLEIQPEGGAAQVFALTNRTEAWLANLEVARRYRWRVSGGGGALEASFVTADEPPRLLRAGGVANFRDLGGWKGLGGRRVRQGRILRSAGLRSSASKKRGGSFLSAAYEPGDVRVTAAGLETLVHEFAVRTDLELRSEGEAACLSGTLLGGARWVHVPFVAYGLIENDERGRRPFARLFRLFLDPAAYPVLMHCSGGRDRTGTLSFLLGGLLGMSADDLCRDWEATAFGDEALSFGPDRIAWLLEYIEGLPGRDFTAKVETFARDCGITAAEIEKFRELMLEDAK